MAQDELGAEKVHSHIGREPSGGLFNMLSLASKNDDGKCLPHNPMINAGAIMACSLVKGTLPQSDRFDHVMEVWQALCGNKRPGFANSTYISERGTADRNFCLGYLMKEAGAFPEYVKTGHDLRQQLEFYFMNCSIEVSCEMMSVVAGTLANGGVCPITSVRVFSAETVRNCLCLTYSCGMYDFSGEFAFQMGFVSKSGVGGSLMVVVPNVMGICTWCPRLDMHGNSVFGVGFCLGLSHVYKFHLFDHLLTAECGDESRKPKGPETVSPECTLEGEDKLDPRMKHNDHTNDENLTHLMYAAGSNRSIDVKRMLARGVNLNAPDYDMRTALHLAASEGHYSVAVLLISHGADTKAKDRFGNTPLDDAIRNEHTQIVKLIEASMKPRNAFIPAEIMRGSSSPGKGFKSDDHFSADLGGAKYDAHDLLLSISRDGRPFCTKAELAMSMYENGLLHSKKMTDNIGKVHRVVSELPKEIDASVLAVAVEKDPTIAEALRGELAIPDWGKFKEELGEIYNDVKSVETGRVASYIPQLAKVNPSYWGVAACSVSGQTCSFGDDTVPFCVQSCVKPLIYCMAVDRHGEETVHKHVGREPSGQNFNEIALQHSTNLPHNPLINSGAIMTCSLINHGEDQSERFDHVMATWEALCGGRRPGFQNSTFLSELATADRNQCLAFLMKEKGVFPEDIKNGEDLQKTLEFYFQCCSIEVDCRAMACIAGTLASGGICPVTGERVFAADTVKSCLSLMFSCGMYDFSGEFAFTCGFPSKSGVAGALLIVIPNVVGLCTYSPRLDELGNSARGIQFCKEFSQKYFVHSFDSTEKSVARKKDLRVISGSDVEHDTALLAVAAGHGDLRTISELFVRGVDLNGADYDFRTAMHIAAAEGKSKVIKWLLQHGAEPSPKDRWDGTPLDDAKQFDRTHCASILVKHGATRSSKEEKKKSPLEVEKIEKAVAKNFLFVRLNKNQRDQVYNSMYTMDIKKGEVVIQQGDKGDCFYIVEQGELEVLVTPIGGGNPKLVHTYRCDSQTCPSFGELALLYNKPRAATIRASTAGRLWVLDRRIFRKILVKTTQYKEVMATLKRVGVLQALSKTDLQRAADLLKEVVYEDGETIARQGGRSRFISNVCLHISMGCVVYVLFFCVAFFFFRSRHNLSHNKRGLRSAHRI
jgi:glutaminase